MLWWGTLRASVSMVVRVYSDYLCPWCYVAAARLHRLQEEYAGRLTIRWHSFLLFREDAHKGWNSYVAAHWQKAQEAEPTLTFTPWRGTTYPATTLPAHVAGKAVARQSSGLFEEFHLDAMRAFFRCSRNIANPSVLRQLAAGVGADLARFDEDMADPELPALVWREFTEGVERDRVIAIPTMFVGTWRVTEGALSLAHYRCVFDTALAAGKSGV